MGLGLGLGFRFSGKPGSGPVSTGPLQVDGFPVLIDTFQIVFA